MRRRFDNLSLTLSALGYSALRIPHFALGKPFRKLKRQQLSKDASHAYAGVVVASAPDGVFFSLIISINRTIQSQLHEPRKAYRPLGFYFCCDFFGDFLQFQQGGADLATSRSEHIEFYGKNRCIFQSDVRATG